MSLILKHFQKRTLETLKSFLEEARLTGPEKAFAKHALSPDGRIPAYRKIAGLEAVPYVCLRLPTGGGKTILAAHSIQVAAQSYIEKDFPLVLWFVPTSTIQAQTIEALKNPSHPYRQAVDDAFEGRVGVFDVDEVDRIRPKDLTESVCIVVSTFAAFRVEETDIRKVYSHNENFEPHFSRIPANAEGLETIKEGPDAGKVKFSFANLLCLLKPLVIMDEAHNARSHLTFEVVKRLSPSCVVEFTATPDYTPKSGSNVLCRVSAAELKAEEMIKLPIVLTEHKDWRGAINAALATRKLLAEAAGGEARLVRPLALFQAENKDKAVTAEVLRQHLIDNEKVDAEKIAVVTGTQKELDGINLFDPNCRIEVIITVQALKEGWDCSFAYVFCSVANIRSGKDVEQLLGRVLRMPYAQRREAPELNKAYAHVSSPSFAEAANNLRDGLVNMGFEEDEAENVIERVPLPFEDDTLPLWAGRQQALKIVLTEKPDLSSLDAEEQKAVEVRTVEPGKVELSVTGEVTHELEQKILVALPKEERAAAKAEFAEHRRQQELRKAPSEKGEKFEVPRLCVHIQGELELAEREVFLDSEGWNLCEFEADLPQFTFDEEAQSFIFDVEGSKVVWHIAETREQLNLGHIGTEWREADFVRWLDKQVRQPDVSQPVMLEFLRRVVATLIEKRKFTMAALARAKFILAKTLQERIRQYRTEALRRGFQQGLFDPQAAVETSFDYSFSFAPDAYPAKWLYKGGYRFQKHYYPKPGELDQVGEEYKCAVALDSLPQVKYWVRNLAIQPNASFWLPTSTDRFYPDFVALLQDGRLFVVEYKGAMLSTTDDSKEKDAIGKLWEDKSKGRALFLMAVDRDEKGREVREQLLAKVL